MNKYIIWDMDGTLVDGEKISEEAFYYACGLYDILIPPNFKFESGLSDYLKLESIGLKKSKSIEIVQAMDEYYIKNINSNWVKPRINV